MVLNRNFETSLIYQNPEDFFRLGGSALMRLNPDAEIEVCRLAANRGILILGIEGGIWIDGLFEARLDAIWDGDPECRDTDDIARNNIYGMEFINLKQYFHNAFIITVRK